MDFSVSVVWTGGFSVFLYVAADAAVSVSASQELAGCHIQFVLATRSFYTLITAVEASLSIMCVLVQLHVESANILYADMRRLNKSLEYFIFRHDQGQDWVSTLNRKSTDGDDIYTSYF